MEVDKETLLDLTILNSYILFSSLGDKKILLKDFRMTLMRNLLAQAGQEWNMRRPVGGTPHAAAIESIRFEERGRLHWPIPSATRRCRMCSERGVTRKVKVICQRCGVALCSDSTCFRDYHNWAYPWNISGRSSGPLYLKLGLRWKSKEKKFKISKICFYLGNRILWIFMRTTEISLF